MFRRLDSRFLLPTLAMYEIQRKAKNISILTIRWRPSLNYSKGRQSVTRDRVVFVLNYMISHNKIIWNCCSNKICKIAEKNSHEDRKYIYIFFVNYARPSYLKFCFISEWTRRDIKEYVPTVEEDDQRATRMVDWTQIHASRRRGYQHVYIYGLTS